MVCSRAIGLYKTHAGALPPAIHVWVVRAYSPLIRSHHLWVVNRANDVSRDSADRVERARSKAGPPQRGRCAALALGKMLSARGRRSRGHARKVEGRRCDAIAHHIGLGH